MPTENEFPDLKIVDLTKYDFDEIDREWGYFDWKCSPDEVLGVLDSDLREHGLVIELGIDGSDGHRFRIVQLKDSDRSIADIGESNVTVVPFPALDAR